MPSPLRSTGGRPFKPMSTVLQFEKREKPVNIDPDLKGFIDRVIVPILVAEYLAVAESQDDVAQGDLDAAHFDRSTAAQEGVRP